VDGPSVGSWAGFVAQEPGFAHRVEQILRAHPHHVIATIRPDGSPRVGGTNVFVDEGMLWIGMMPAAARVGDLRRDGRCAVHSAPLDEHLGEGDVRMDLLADELDPAAAERLLAAGGHGGGGGGVVFALAVRAVSLVRVEGDELLLELFRPGRPLVQRRLTG
jgi:hypothetical protein